MVESVGRSCLPAVPWSWCILYRHVGCRSATPCQDAGRVFAVFPRSIVLPRGFSFPRHVDVVDWSGSKRRKHQMRWVLRERANNGGAVDGRWLSSFGLSAAVTWQPGFCATVVFWRFALLLDHLLYHLIKPLSSDGCSGAISLRWPDTISFCSSIIAYEHPIVSSLSFSTWCWGGNRWCVLAHLLPSGVVINSHRSPVAVELMSAW